MRGPGEDTFTFTTKDRENLRKYLLNGGFILSSPGCSDPRGDAEPRGEGLAVEKMETALSNLLPKLKTEADFIVQLAFTDEATLHALAVACDSTYSGRILTFGQRFGLPLVLGAVGLMASVIAGRHYVPHIYMQNDGFVLER